MVVLGIAIINIWGLAVRVVLGIATINYGAWP